MNAQVEKLMKALGISEEEALQLIEDDKAVDRMKDREVTSDLTLEQKRAVKSATKVGTKKPTVYKFDTQKKPRKENIGKKTLVSALRETIEKMGATDIDVTNPERELAFAVDGVKYKVVLSCPRK